MDLIRIIYRLRPDVTWAGNVINASSKQTLQETYQSSQPFPTNAEGLAAWQEIQAEDAAEAQEVEELAADMADIEKANTYLTNKLTDLTSLTVPERVILRDTLLRMFSYFIKRI